MNEELNGTELKSKKSIWRWLRWFLLAIGILIVLAAGFYLTFIQPKAKDSNSSSESSISENVKSQTATQKCTPPIFTAPPINSADFAYFVPMGMVTGGHVTPIDHGYFYPTNWQDKNAEVDVHSPADGNITQIDFEDQSVNPQGQQNFANWVSIEYPCNIKAIYLLMTKLSPSILAKIGSLPVHSNKKIPVKAGEVIGKVAGRSLDFMVTDDNSTLTGFINPKSYDGESWKIHIVDPFKYFDEKTKAIILAKDIRQAEPRGGKIDYDIDGKLVGSWFVEGSGGYSGDRSHPDGYWKGHLAFVYDHIDPSFIKISIGDYAGKALPGTGESASAGSSSNAVQFDVKGNAPDPATIGIESGLVKYELVGWNIINSKTGQRWDSKTWEDNLTVKNNDVVVGTVLVQVFPNQKIKFEAFPDKKASEVLGFDDNAKIYVR